MTLEEFFDREGTAAKHLKKGIETHLEVLLPPRMTKEDKKLLLRMILISVRQCLQDYGDES